MENCFRYAVENIAKYGDTDVFPFPVENLVFFDETEKVVAILMKMHADLNKAIEDFPLTVEGMLSPVGYTGFRWATQIDPIWNAYFLGLVISIGDKIEQARLPLEKQNVFSYRYQLDEDKKTIFNKSIGWAEFQRESVEKARKSKFVLVCDISDFYPSIYHHRLENALQKATSPENMSVCRQIMKLLMHFSGNVSYGLPVGGPASRLLSELLLNRVDRLLSTSGIDFCRFADDYHIFADSAEEAYRALIFISVKLHANEGLLLQKAKTKIISSEEFLSTSEFAVENEPENQEQAVNRTFLRLRLHYDPYSATADADYELLKDEVTKFDIVGMLGRELKKSRIHQSLTKKLISAIKLLSVNQRDAAISSLIENLPVLYPVFPNILHLVKGLINDIGIDTRLKVFGKLRELLVSNSYITSVPTHLAYTVRILAHDDSDESDEILIRIYRESTSSSIRRDVILAMAKKNADFWISDVRTNFRTVTEWERTALLTSSFVLGDEGEHWRKSIKLLVSPMQKLVMEWTEIRSKNGNNEVPI
jgi:hypothetical protein